MAHVASFVEEIDEYNIMVTTNKNPVDIQI